MTKIILSWVDVDLWLQFFYEIFATARYMYIVQYVYSVIVGGLQKLILALSQFYMQINFKITIIG